MQFTRKNILEAGAEFFNLPQVKERMPAQVQQDITDKKKEFLLAEYYFRKRLDGSSGIQNLIKKTDVREVGITNLDKGQLPADVWMAICGLRLSYGFSATSGAKADQARYSNSEYLNTIPTIIHSSETRLKCGETKIIECRTSKFFANAYAEYAGQANEENLVMLPQPRLGNPNKMFDLEIEFSANATALTINATNNHFVELVLIGVQIVDRPAA